MLSSEVKMVLILIVILLLGTGSCTESYMNAMSDFINLTLSSCPGVFDCKSNSTDNRECSCEDDCLWKSTCCYDAPAYDQERLKAYSDRSRCTVGRRMVFGCNAEWGQDEIQELCEANSVRDPLLHLPVTSKDTGIVYPNYYCAICNRDADDVFVADYSFSCDGPPEFEGIFQSTLQKVLGDVANSYDDYSIHGDRFYDENNSEKTCSDCYLRNARITENNGLVNRNLNITYFGSQNWLTSLYAGAQHYEVECTLVIISNSESECRYSSAYEDKCHPDWEDKLVEELCRSFRGPVQYRGKAFKNVFCGICNFECFPADSCTPVSLPHGWSSFNYFDSDSPTAPSFSSTITKKHSNSTGKYIEDIFPGYCNGGENKLLCALSPAYHRKSLCVKRDREERVRSYLACRQNLDSFTMSDFVNQTLSYCPGTFDCKSNYTHNYGRRGCDCDNDCAKRSTCCHDAPAYNAGLIKKNIGRSKCFWHREIFSGCDEGWKDSETLNLCEAADPESFGNNKEDLILHLPVTSNKTQITYANYYCAVCNHDAEDIVLWDYEFDCYYDRFASEIGLLRQIIQRVLDTNAEENWERVILEADLIPFERNERYGYECRTYTNNDGNIWYVKFNDTDIKSFSDSNIRLDESWIKTLEGVHHARCSLRLWTNPGRSCCMDHYNHKKIEKCDENWTDSEVEELCQSFNGPISIDSNNKYKTYRNVFCAICNHEFISSPDDLCDYGTGVCSDDDIGIRPLTHIVKPNVKDKPQPPSNSNSGASGFSIPRPCAGINSFVCSKSNPIHRNKNERLFT